MKKKLYLLVVSVALLGSSQIFAQDDLVNYVLDSCETELTTYCSQVTPGEGRLLHCAAAHEDK